MQINHLLILASAALAAGSSGRFPAPLPKRLVIPGNETAALLPSFTFEQILSLQKRFFDQFIFSNNQIQVGWKKRQIAPRAADHGAGYVLTQHSDESNSSPGIPLAKTQASSIRPVIYISKANECHAVGKVRQLFHPRRQCARPCGCHQDLLRGRAEYRIPLWPLLQFGLDA